MRIIIPIKQVPETNAVKMDEETGTMVRDGVQAIVNPLDLYAIELAIQLRESSDDPDSEVIAITMGPPNAQVALREAISMGVDSAVLISDRAFAGADTWATSYVLAAAIQKLPPADLILCGERATDGDTGQVGPGIAAFMDLPVATYVGRFDSIQKNACRVHRLVETGYEVLDVQMPAVITVVKEVADPRLPTLRGKQKSRKTDIPILTAEDLDVDPSKLGLNGSPTRVVKISRPKVARTCEKLPATDEASINTAADRIVDFLKQRDLI